MEHLPSDVGMATKDERAWRGSDRPAIDRIAQPPLHELGVSQLDGQRRLEPRHATGKPEIVKGRRRALAPTFEQLFGGPTPRM